MTLSRKQLRTALINVALVFGALLFTYVALEVALRLTAYPRQEIRFVCFDEVMGTVYCPGVRDTFLGPEGPYELRTNSDGLMTREYAVAKPAATYRIALLGDSIVASNYLDPHVRIDGMWEKELPERLNQEVEVINFAVQGTGTWEQLQMYHLKARKYRPDLVVLGFYWGNDVWNNTTKLDKGAPNPLHDDYNARFRRRVSAAHRGFSRWVWNHSLAYQFLRTLSDKTREALRQIKTRGWREVATDVTESVQRSASAAPPHLGTHLGTPEYDWDSRDWDLTRNLILKLKSEVEADGARLAVFHFPAIIHERSKLPAAAFQSFLEQHRIASFDLFGLYDAQDQARYLSQFIPGDVHWTQEGHALAARYSLPALSSIILESGSYPPTARGSRFP